MTNPQSSDPGDEVLARANLRIGTVLRGKYRIDRVLGVGGMAVVYAATHRNQAEFAIKMLHPELSTRSDVRTRFLREGYAANMVKHPGSVAVVDDDLAEDGAAFIVMEMLRGSTVEGLAVQAGGHLPPAAVLAIGHQLLDVLASAHEKGIVHRDIKPANLFITHDGSLKVLDFGIARLRDSTSGMATGTGLMLGTPAFMAPEQALGKTSDIDAQTDVWAVGASLFWLLSGLRVHEGDNASQLLIQAGTAQARSILAVVPELSEDIAAVIDMALVFKKEGRWLNATAMRDAIRGIYLSQFGAVSDRGVLAELVGPPANPLLGGEIVPSARPFSTPGPGRLSSVPGKTDPRNQSPLAGPAVPTIQAVANTPAVTALETQPPSSRVDEEHGRTGRRAKRAWVLPVSIAGAGGVALAAFLLGSIGGKGGAQDASRVVASPSAVMDPAPHPSERAAPAAVPAPAASPPPTVQVAPLAAPVLEPPSSAAAPPPPSPPYAKPETGARSKARTPSAAGAPVQPPLAPPAPPAQSAQSTKSNCNPSYYFDSEGTKHFKPECF